MTTSTTEAFVPRSDAVQILESGEPEKLLQTIGMDLLIFTEEETREGKAFPTSKDIHVRDHINDILIEAGWKVGIYTLSLQPNGELDPQGRHWINVKPDLVKKAEIQKLRKRDRYVWASLAAEAGLGTTVYFLAPIHNDSLCSFLTTLLFLGALNLLASLVNRFHM